MATILSAERKVRPPLHLIDSECDTLFDLALTTAHKHPLVSEMLLAEIERAEIHDAGSIAPDVITLGSHVDFVDDGSNRLRSIELVLPGEADIEAGRVSILTPIGAGLIGLSMGQTIDWPDLDGHDRRLRILAVRQPER